MKLIERIVLILTLAAGMRGQTSTPLTNPPGGATATPGACDIATKSLLAAYGAAVEEPFQQEVELSIGAANSAAYASIPVPAGKRLVIEYMSLFGFLPAGQKLNLSVVTLVAGFRASYRPQITAQDAGDGTISISANQTMRVYAESGSVVSFNAIRNASSGGTQITVSVSGHYVTLP